MLIYGTYTIRYDITPYNPLAVAELINRKMGYKDSVQNLRLDRECPKSPSLTSTPIKITTTTTTKVETMSIPVIHTSPRSRPE